MKKNKIIRKKSITFALSNFEIRKIFIVKYFIIYKKMKNLLQNIFHLFGYHIRQNKKSQEEIEAATKQKFLDENQWLKEKKILTIFDIGANAGQFAKLARLLFPEAKIFSFEPIPFVYEQLKANFANDANFEAFNLALGEKNGEVSFFLNEFSYSSSLLKMKSSHKEAFPFTVGETEIKVNEATLDSIFKDAEIKSPYLVKLDVQGFEDKVINGGKNIIKNADYIITEVSFVELYENQPLFNVIYDKITEMGFRYVGNFEQMHSPLNGEILQADAIFKKVKN